jgi:hypothetical protein
MNARAVWLGFLLLALTGCDNSTSGGSPIVSSATIAGRVTDTTGAAVIGARIVSYVDTVPSRCTRPTATNGIADADSLGLYQVIVVAAAVVDSACAFLHVYGPQGTTLRDTLVGPRRVALRDQAPFDSITVNVVLSP